MMVMLVAKVIEPSMVIILEVNRKRTNRWLNVIRTNEITGLLGG